LALGATDTLQVREFPPTTVKSHRFTSWDSRQPCMELEPQDNHPLAESSDSLSVIGLLRYVPMLIPSAVCFAAMCVRRAVCRLQFAVSGSGCRLVVGGRSAETRDGVIRG